MEAYLEKLKKIKCFVMDMDGTIYLNNQLFEWTHPFLDQVHKVGKAYVFFTNNSSKHVAFYKDKLNSMGIVVGKQSLFNSNQVAIDYLKHMCGKQKVYVVGTQYLIEDFQAAGFDVNEGEPEYVVIGFDTTLTYEKVRVACDYIRAGIPVIGINIDYNCPVEKGFIPDCGAISAMITASTGKEITFCGKPSSLALQYILRETGYQEDEVAFVGDRIYTDVAICSGNKATSIMVLTGEGTLEDLKDSPYQPDIICESLETLMEMLKRI